MKSLMIAAAAAALSLATASAALAADVTVSVSGVQARGGTLYIALQNRSQFMQRAMTSGDLKANPEAGTVTFTMHGVPAGEYAVSVLHDEDGDHQMKREADGRPLEGWAMVNYSGSGRPDFDRIKLTVREDGASAHANMVYPR